MAPGSRAWQSPSSVWVAQEGGCFGTCYPVSHTFTQPSVWSYTSSVETSALNIGLAMSSRRTWRACWIIDMYVLKSASV